MNDVVTKLERWQAAMIPYLDRLTPPTTGGKFPTHRMGVHWIPGSNRQSDHAYMKALKPGVIKIVSLDRTRIAEAESYLQDTDHSILLLRDHPLSEQHDDMRRDPAGTGKRHALEWRRKLEGNLSIFNHANTMVCGINEPFVRSEAEERVVFEYTKAFLLDCAAYSIRALALNLSVGWPRNSDTDLIKNTTPIWDTFRPLEDIILAGNHALGLHEYWRDDPDEGWFQNSNGEKWGWNAHRHWACPMSVPIIIGECGLTKHVNGKPAPGQSGGWIGNVTPAQYAEQLWRYASKCHDNVLAVLPFTTDMASADWIEDDTLMAHNDIVNQRRAHTWPAVWPVKVTTKPAEPPIKPPADNTLIMPKITGKISGYYGQLYTNSAGRQYPHEGIGVSMPSRTPLYAAADGIVAWSDTDTAYGEYVRVYHPQLGVCLFYAHMSRRDVQTGNSVKAGQQIGLSGNTGNSSGPHLHLEVRRMTPEGRYMSGVGIYDKGRQDVLSWLGGWLAHGGKIEER